MSSVLVTGSSGLIGSEVARYYHERGFEVHGIDNNMRRDLFGPDGDTDGNRARLSGDLPGARLHEMDIRDRVGILGLLERIRPGEVVHCAAQPSHELSRERPLDDFDINAVGTLNLLEATRRWSPEAPFSLLSTNKVYGDRPNQLPLEELELRWDYARQEDFHGIDESCSIDACEHSPFGASKTAADIMAQEYARCYGLRVGVFRCGCLTGSSQAGVENHGFLSYLARAVVQGLPYRIYGYKGKQVRDNLHGFDVASAVFAFGRSPRPGEVYNLGGGRANSVSVIEAIRRLERLTGKSLQQEYVQEHRRGDHICYISDTRKFGSHFPEWKIARDLDAILQDLLSHLA